MAGVVISTFLACLVRPRSVHRTHSPRFEIEISSIDRSLIGRDQFANERRRRIRNQQRINRRVLRAAS